MESPYTDIAGRHHRLRHPTRYIHPPLHVLLGTLAEAYPTSRAGTSQREFPVLTPLQSPFAAMATTKAAKQASEPPPDASTLSSLERLILAQAIYEFGADHMSQVAQLLDTHPMLSRPKNFFSAKVSARRVSFVHKVPTQAVFVCFRCAPWCTGNSCQRQSSHRESPVVLRRVKLNFAQTRGCWKPAPYVTLRS